MDMLPVRTPCDRAAAACLFCIVLSACGGEPDKGGADSGAGASVPTAPTTEPTTTATPTPTPTTTDCAMVDGDGDGASLCDDCNDGDPTVFPGANERCNGRDDNCDDLPHPDEVDVDGDGALDCSACDRSGLWWPTRDVEGEALRTLLHTLTAVHDCFDYGDTTDFLFLTLDNSADTVRCVYTGREVVVIDEKPDPGDMNTEHSWPQSLGADAEPAKCDLHHLYPTDADANNARAAYPFGEVTGAVDWSVGESHLGVSTAGVLVFEPPDAHKGNVARSMLYFAMRYDHAIDADQQALYKAWDAADPVDETELLRTQSIGSRQGIANPYVSCPELVGWQLDG
jgi:deoxyribonuclease I